MSESSARPSPCQGPSADMDLVAHQSLVFRAFVRRRAIRKAAANTGRTATSNLHSVDREGLSRKVEDRRTQR